MTDPIDPFWSPPTPERTFAVDPPVRWQVRDSIFWVAEGGLVRPVSVMPRGHARRLLAALNDQAETDLLAAYRDLPLLTAVRRHVARLEQP